METTTMTTTGIKKDQTPIQRYLIKEMIKRGISKRDLVRASVSTSTLSQIEKGIQKTVTQSTARKMVNAGIAESGLTPYIRKHGSTHRWSKKAKKRVRRSNAGKRAWQTRKAREETNGKAQVLMVTLEEPFLRYVVVDTKDQTITDTFDNLVRCGNA